ncbi:uncharacterized protein [Leptinotarsa decemlineata]|uniref:uncharacterized protein n=1 Tax=Leptinotarsa decemlineata TaxID=7539 RepID=UPI003D30718C
MFRLMTIFVSLRLCLSQDITNIKDIQVLSELSLEKLLSVRRAFHAEDNHKENNASEDVSSSSSVPQALALQSKKSAKDRGSYHPHPSYHYEEIYVKEDKSKVQTIFQISVTALAFLAFGGYLLCLLIHAIKGKQNPTTTNNAVAQAMATYLATRVKVRRKTTRRPQRVNLPNNYRRRPRPKRDIFQNELREEDMYYALLNLSEAYTSYHTVDYTHFNSSINY